MRKEKIDIRLELADNGAIIRWFDEEGCEHTEVAEGDDNLIAKKVGKFITTQMDYDLNQKANIKIEIEYEEND